MTRRLMLRGALLIALAAAGAATALAVAGPILKTSHNARLGAIVVNAKGLTLYHLTGEKNGVIKCTGECTAFWPPVLWSGKGKPPVGPGVDAAKLGTVKRPNGSTQLTYNKFPLYRYYLDKQVGQDERRRSQERGGYVVCRLARRPDRQSPRRTTTTATAGTTTQGATTTTGARVLIARLSRRSNSAAPGTPANPDY